VSGRLKVAQYNLTVPIPNASMDAVVQLVDGAARPTTPPGIDAHYNKAYEAATTAAGFEPLEEAATALLGVMPEAKQHPELDTEFWLHNELTWVRWEQGDLTTALDEVDAAVAALDHGTLHDAKRTALRLHALWDRAFLFLEVAMHAPPVRRGRLLAIANAAKDAYDRLATTNQDNDGMAVLEAFFLTAAGKGKAAAAAARKVDVDKDEDLQDLYVIARAFDANKEQAAADAVVERICTGHVYLMKPLILRHLAREGRSCPAHP
jgi:hypothetical protein